MSNRELLESTVFEMIVTCLEEVESLARDYKEGEDSKQEATEKLGELVSMTAFNISAIAELILSGKVVPTEHVTITEVTGDETKH